MSHKEITLKLWWWLSLDIIDKSGLDSWSDLLPEFNESGFMKESWYIWLVVVDPVPELEAEDEGLKNGDEDGDKAPFFGSKVPNLRPFSVRNLGGWIPAGGLTSSRSFWLFLAFISSAASALDMFSCFFHLVRRFWNQIFTWKVNNMYYTGYSFWDRLHNFLHKFTWVVLSVHKLNKLGKFW